MPRYHFDLVDHRIVEDHGRQILEDDVTAADVADELAARIYDVRPELRGMGYSILVAVRRGAKSTARLSVLRARRHRIYRTNS